MKQCEFCGASLPDEASFCGRCGQIPSRVSQQATHIVDFPTVPLESTLDDDQPTILTASGKHTVPNTGRTPSGSLRPVVLVPLEEDNEDEEEKRRRAALLGLGLPLFGDLANQPPAGQVPVLYGTPQMAHVPVIPNTPSLPGSAAGPGSPVFPGGPGSWQVPPQPGTMPPQSPPYTPPYTPPGHTGGAPGGSTGTGTGTAGGSSGCLTIGLIILAAILIIASIFVGLGLTVFAPNLTLSGSSNVVPGSNMTLHGNNFLPNSSVTLTLDVGTPIYVFQPLAPRRLAYGHAQLAAGIGLITQASASSKPASVVSVQGDGTFNAIFQVNPSWSPGQHAIHATESVSHRSASLTFTITQPGATPTPTSEPTTTPTPTSTNTPTPTPTTPTTPASTLSCANPGNLALGPVSEFSSQVATGTITLCTSGSGTLTWNASWNQSQAPWLQLNRTSGSVLAPAQDQVTATAFAANLKAGTYTTTITFIGVESNTTQAVNVTFTVKATCARITPPSLSFVGVAGGSDPQPQTVSIVNCGLTSDWSATVGSSGSNWLTISPSRGTVKSNSTAIITVAVSIANLKAGTYTDTITIKIGAQSNSVTVTLTVDAPPTISANPDPVNSNCFSDPSGNGDTDCTATLTNNSADVSLTWSATASVSGVTVQASGNSISAGSSETVTIVIPSNICTNVTITFTGPANSSPVTWDCSPLQ